MDERRSDQWFVEILARIDCASFPFPPFHLGGGRDERLYLQAQRRGRRGRKWWLSRHMTLSEVVRTAFMALQAYEEHELREAFRFDGALVFGPHLSVEALRAVSRHEDRRRDSMGAWEQEKDGGETP